MFVFRLVPGREMKGVRETVEGPQEEGLGGEAADYGVSGSGSAAQPPQGQVAGEQVLTTPQGHGRTRGRSTPRAVGDTT